MAIESEALKELNTEAMVIGDEAVIADEPVVANDMMRICIQSLLVCGTDLMMSLLMKWNHLLTLMKKSGRRMLTWVPVLRMRTR